MISLPQLLDGDGRDILTHSRMACAKQCLRKHLFRYGLGLRSTADDSRALRVGRAIHLGLEAAERGLDRDAAIATATAGYVTVPAWAVEDEQQFDWAVEREVVARLLAGYLWRWSEDRIETVAAELPFLLPIVNPETGATTPTFQVGGKIDGIVRLADGRLMVRETKTTGQDIGLDSDYWRQLRLDSQISLYLLAARAIGHEVEGVIYDVIRKPTIRPRKLTKADLRALVLTGKYHEEAVALDPAATSDLTRLPDRETPEMYGARLLDDITERPDHYYARVEIPRLESDLEEFRQELWDQQKTLREHERTGRWYRNTASCVTVYGRCSYFDICANALDPSVDVPAGFEVLPFVHPELVEGDDDAYQGTTTQGTPAAAS
jgi:hypothetical protein